ncbi:hypothetical protein R3P38DRAFT_2851398 [Favolaschia claudopus]|uniref:Uncharacterized protein n=1 Tax=Favolaschia claudopus TaxID=2862362 RepID=A0AAW0DLH4_9AGAR
MVPRTLSSLYIFTSALSLLQITFAFWAILSFGFGINTGESSSAGIHSFVAVSAIVALSLVYKTRRRRINSRRPRTIYGEIQIITFFMAFWFAAGVYYMHMPCPEILPKLGGGDVVCSQNDGYAAQLTINLIQVSSQPHPSPSYYCQLPPIRRWPHNANVQPAHLRACAVRSWESTRFCRSCIVLSVRLPSRQS